MGLLEKIIRYMERKENCANGLEKRIRPKQKKNSPNKKLVFLCLRILEKNAAKGN